MAEKLRRPIWTGEIMANNDRRYSGQIASATDKEWRTLCAATLRADCPRYIRR